jgi:hypothetical protein
MVLFDCWPYRSGLWLGSNVGVSTHVIYLSPYDYLIQCNYSGSFKQGLDGILNIFPLPIHA